MRYRTLITLLLWSISRHKDGDISPEGLVFIPASESANGRDLLVVTYEVSDSIAVFDVHLTPQLDRISTYAGSGSEIAAYNADTARVFVVTGGDVMDVLSIANPTTPTLVMTIPLGFLGGGINSVTVS